MNVLFIVLDALRKDKLSIYNDDIDFTENLQQFSENALVFDEAVSQAPWSLPSHASMFTGLYPWEHNVTVKNHNFQADRETLAEKLDNKGHQTACYTSNTWISPETGLTEGFDEVDNLQIDWSENTFYTILDRIGQADKIQSLQNSPLTYFLPNRRKPIPEAKKFIKESEDSFFIFMNLLDTHLQFSPPKQYRKKHAPNVDPNTICQDSVAHNFGQEETDFEALQSLYEAEVDHLDDKLGRFFSFLKEEDVFEDTLFVITSDHGENLGENGLIGHMYSVSENLVNVPLIVKAPNVSEGRFKEQFELKDLHNLIPDIVEGEFSIEGCKYALGGFERPKIEDNYPEEILDKLRNRLRFVRNAEQGKKLVKRSINYEMKDLETGETISIDSAYIQELCDKSEEAVAGWTIDQEEESEIRDRLADLGYM